MGMTVHTLMERELFNIKSQQIDFGNMNKTFHRYSLLDTYIPKTLKILSCILFISKSERGKV